MSLQGYVVLVESMGVTLTTRQSQEPIRRRVVVTSRHESTLSDVPTSHSTNFNQATEGPHLNQAHLTVTTHVRSRA